MWIGGYCSEGFSFCHAPDSLQKQLKGGYKVTEHHLSLAVRLRYRQMLLQLLDHFDSTALTDRLAAALWEIAIIRGDICYLDFLLSTLPLVQSFNGKLDLILAALIFAPHIFLWIQNHMAIDAVITSDTAIALSLEFGSTSVCWQLLSSQGLSSRQIAEYISEWLSNKFYAELELIEELDRLFLSSPLSHIALISQVLAEKYPEYCLALDEAQNKRRQWGSLICRYSSSVLHSYLMQIYRLPLDRYSQEQKKLGEQAYALMASECDKLVLNCSVRELFNSFATWNSALAASRGEDKRAKECLVFRDQCPDMARETLIGNAMGESPYALVLPLVEQSLQEAYDGMRGGELSFSLEPLGYRIYYEPEQGTGAIALTSVIFHPEAVEWMFCHDVDPIEAWKHLEAIHKAILAYSGPQEGLQRLIATGFWLGSHIMISWRGNGLYMKMLMALWYRYHRLQAPLPCLQYPNSDVVALAVPLSRFANTQFFLSLFESFVTIQDP